jgi:hypothetical protein
MVWHETVCLDIDIFLLRAFRQEFEKFTHQFGIAKPQDAVLRARGKETLLAS